MIFVTSVLCAVVYHPLQLISNVKMHSKNAGHLVRIEVERVIVIVESRNCEEGKVGKKRM